MAPLFHRAAIKTGELVSLSAVLDKSHRTKRTIILRRTSLIQHRDDRIGIVGVLSNEKKARSVRSFVRSFVRMSLLAQTLKLKRLECGPMPNVMAALPNISAPSVQRRKVWLTPTTRVPCSTAAKTRNPLKFAGVPQTTGLISAVSGPKFTIL